jgi:hypothetical protein
MSGWIDAVISPLKAAGDTAQRLLEIRDTVKFGEAIVKLQSDLLSAQHGALTAQGREATLLDELNQLKRRISDLEAWQKEQERYELTRLEPGVFVFALKLHMAVGEPTHCICQTCYQRGKKSILHSDERRNGIYHLICNECGTKLEVGCYVRPHMQEWAE